MYKSKLKISQLQSYPNHPFALYEGKRMADMVESIKTYGILSPILVRPIGGAKYQILSGHNRVEAAKQLNMTEVPAIVMDDISDDEAAFIVSESNVMQRSIFDMKYSERAFVLKDHLEKVKKLTGGQGMRSDLLTLLSVDQDKRVAHKSKSRDKVAEQYALSKDTVMRYIRLTKLPKGILDRLDNEKLKFIPAVEITWMSENELNMLSEILDNTDKGVSLNHSRRLRVESNRADGMLSKEDIIRILSEGKARGKRKITLPVEIMNRLDYHGLDSDLEILAIITQHLDALESGSITEK